MLVVLLHARFSVVGPIPFLLAAIFFPGHPYIIGSTTVLPDSAKCALKIIIWHLGGKKILHFNLAPQFKKKSSWHHRHVGLAVTTCELVFAGTTVLLSLHLERYAYRRFHTL